MLGWKGLSCVSRARLQDQLTQGLISLDQFTEQADGKLRLMRLEGQ